MTVKTAVLFLAGQLILGCASNSSGHKTKSEIQSKKISGISAEELRIGEEINAAILSSFRPYTEPRLTGYVSGIGGALAEDADRRLPYQFIILYSDKIYATSAPGGFIYITTGLLYFLNNEAELAAVLAHEIGELQFQDPKLSRSRKVLEAVTKGGSAVGPAFGGIGMLATLGLVAVSAAAQSQILTPEERIRRADKKALHYMVEAGYDPQGMIDLLYKFLNAKQETLPYFYDYYQARPINELRFSALSREFSKLPMQGKSFETHPQNYQEMTKGVREIYEQ